MLPVTLSYAINLKKGLKLFFLICILLGRNQLQAQQACFIVLNDTLDNPQAAEGEYSGCVPFAVKARNCSDGFVSYNFQYSGTFNPIEFKQDSIWVYQQTGTYTIAQFRGPGIPLQTKIIRVFDPETQAAFSWFTCGKKLLLEFTDTVFNRYSFVPQAGADSIIVSFSGNDPKKFEYSYASVAGSPFTYSIRGIKPSTCNKDLLTQKISLYENPLAPVPLLLEASGSDTLGYRVKFSVRADEEYAFQQAGPAGEFAGLISPGRSEENETLELQLSLNGNQLQGGRLRPFTRKRCANATDTLLAAPHWTIFWPLCTPQNQKINLSWPKKPIAGLQLFQIYRDGELIASPPFQDGNYLDEDNLVCGKEYQYHFITKVLRNGPTSTELMEFISPRVNARAISSNAPPAVQHISASVLPAGIEVLAGPADQAKSFHLFRKEGNSSSYSEIGSGFNNLPLMDSSAEINSKSYCYRISFDDVCGNRSELSDSICPVLLKAKLLDDGSIDFSWTSMKGWKDGIWRYELIRKSELQADETKYAGEEPEYRQEGQDKTAKTLRFLVKSMPRLSNTYQPSFSNEVIVVQESRLRCPDAFTPNQDFSNDEFKCYSSFLKEYKLLIYNSWGNVVFSTDKSDEGWDGKIDGQQAPPGNYGYRLWATDESGKRLERSGLIALLR